MKLFIIPLFVLIFFINSCNKKESPDSKAEVKSLKTGLVFDIGGRGDKSFNDAAYKGLEEAKEKLGKKEQHDLSGWRTAPLIVQQHLDVRGHDGDQQQDQPDPRSAAPPREQEPSAAGEFRNSADLHQQRVGR